MTREDIKFLEPILDMLPWNNGKKMPLAKERIVVFFKDGSLSFDYAINFILFWRYVEMWTYFENVIAKRYINNKE